MAEEHSQRVPEAANSVGAPKGSGAQDRLVTLRDPRSPSAEAFRTLRTNIQFSSLDQPIRTLLLTSASSEEGKSTILANLGVTFAQAGSRTVLVDCDLRRPSLHSLFELDNTAGLTTAVIGEATEALPLRETSVANLWVLPSGPLPPNPAELLASRRMDALIQRLKEQADLVLFDAPPVIAVTDAAILAGKVDGVLLILAVGKTKREHANRAKAALERVNARLLGAVLNDVRLDSRVYRYTSG
ncbi:MAG: CpsD/CapB family tyrosine-protein kinase [Chloroflexi bacterium]|nr:CpsD/CapB family tyrosine-protein kinase [Chloroflexota bacterium]